MEAAFGTHIHIYTGLGRPQRVNVVLYFHSNQEQTG